MQQIYCFSTPYRVKELSIFIIYLFFCGIAPRHSFCSYYSSFFVNNFAHFSDWLILLIHSFIFSLVYSIPAKQTFNEFIFIFNNCVMNYHYRFLHFLVKFWSIWKNLKSKSYIFISFLLNPNKLKNMKYYFWNYQVTKIRINSQQTFIKWWKILI